MAIRPIDSVTGADGVRDTRAQAAVLGSRRVNRQESGAVVGSPEAEKTKTEEPKKPGDAAAEAASSTSLRFKVDQDSGKTVAEVLDPEGQVLRQMPTEEALEVAKAIGKFQGMFVNLKV